MNMKKRKSIDQIGLDWSYTGEPDMWARYSYVRMGWYHHWRSYRIHYTTDGTPYIWYKRHTYYLNPNDDNLYYACAVL